MGEEDISTGTDTQNSYSQLHHAETPLQNVAVNKQKKLPESPLCGSCRWALALVYFSGTITIYLMRANLSVAIVCMNKNSHNLTLHYNTSVPGEVLQETEYGYTGEFSWSRFVRGLILAAFYIGYSSGQPVCGWLTTRGSGKWIMFTGITAMTSLTFLSPLAARIGPYYLFAVQIMKGWACSVFYTSITALLGVWAPPNERSLLTAAGNSGSLWGTVLSFSFSGLLCEYGFDGGWPSVFYVYGLVAVLWLGFWLYFVYDSPAHHPRISKIEKEYIETSLQGVETKTPPVPWRGMLTSLPFYAILVADFTYSFTWYTVLTCLPQYMQDVFKFSIKANGLLSAVPYCASWVVALLVSFTADHMLQRQLIRVGTVRKATFAISMVSSSVLLVAVSFLDEDQAHLGVFIMTLAMAGLGFIRSAHYANMLDIAPRFAGLVMGISNSNLSGFIAPVVSGALVHSGSRLEWQYVFIVSAAIALFGVIVYTVFASGEIQSWALVEEQEEDSSEKETKTALTATEQNGACAV